MATKLELIQAIGKYARVQVKTRQLPAVSKERIGMANGPLLDGFIKTIGDYGVYLGEVVDHTDTEMTLKIGITPVTTITERKENVIAVGYRIPLPGPGLQFKTQWAKLG